MTQLKTCLLAPVPAVYDAARLLDAAVTAHLIGRLELAAELIDLANRPAVRDWAEALWGKGGPWSRPLRIDDNLPSIPKAERVALRMPTELEKRALIDRDGRHCRFCGVPLIRKEVRERMHAAYPQALPWGSTNASQHAGFQALWLQYDHLVPHARGGGNALENILVTCAPCNYGRSNLTLLEVGVSDPRERAPVRSTWDGLERFL